MGRRVKLRTRTNTVTMLGIGIALGLGCLGAAPGPTAAAEPGLQGSWTPETYVLRDGAELPVTGLIFFTESDWTVLFFVTGEDGKPLRGSGEGGTYTLQGDRLTFVHRYHLSAGEPVASLPEAPLRMDVSSAAAAGRESCRVEVSERTMTIFFPSGNEMRFRRAAG